MNKNSSNKQKLCVWSRKLVSFTTLDQGPQSLTLRPEQASGAQALLRALSSWLHKRGFAGPQTRVPRDWTDCSPGGDADFEALTTKIEDPELDPTKNNTAKIEQHESCSYSYVIVRRDGETEHSRRRSAKSKAVLVNPKALHMTREDWRTYNSATTCHICEKPLAGTPSAITAISRGNTEGPPTTLATSSCAWTRKPPRSRWSFTTCGAISKVKGKVSCIPNNTEKYIVLPGAAALYWQRSASASISWQAGGGEPVWGFRDHSAIRAERG